MNHVNKNRDNLIPDILNSQKAIEYRDIFIRDGECNDPRNKKYALYSEDVEVFNNLQDFFDYKCVYCEKKTGTAKFNADHFRPRNKIKDENNNQDTITGYYWLWYSWDNLIFTCEICNSNKANYFKIKDEKYRIVFKKEDLKKIHSLVYDYNKSEEPLFIYPELDKVTIGDEKANSNELKVYFNKFELASNNNRINYTIEKCGLKDRLDLVEERAAIVDTINKKIDDIKLSYKTEPERLDEIKKYLISIKKDKTGPHVLFRQYIVNNSRNYINYIRNLLNNP